MHCVQLKPAARRKAARPGNTLVSGTPPPARGGPLETLRGWVSRWPCCLMCPSVVGVGFEPCQAGSQVPSQTAGLNSFVFLLCFVPLALPLLWAWPFLLGLASPWPLAGRTAWQAGSNFLLLSSGCSSQFFLCSFFLLDLRGCPALPRQLSCTATGSEISRCFLDWLLLPNLCLPTSFMSC